MIKIFNKKTSILLSGIVFISVMFDNDVFAKTVKNKTFKKVEQKTNKKTEQKREFYTSVIINCNGMSLGRSMSPVLFDNKYNEVYPSTYSKYMSTLDVMEGKVFIYEKTINSAKNNVKAGKKPLIVKAIDLEGLFKSNPVISREDSIKIKLADFDGKFLKEKKVIFVY